MIFSLYYHDDVTCQNLWTEIKCCAQFPTMMHSVEYCTPEQADTEYEGHEKEYVCGQFPFDHRNFIENVLRWSVFAVWGWYRVLTVSRPAMSHDRVVSLPSTHGQRSQQHPVSCLVKILERTRLNRWRTFFQTMTTTRPQSSPSLNLTLLH